MFRVSYAMPTWLAFAIGLFVASSCGGTSVTYQGGSGGTGGSAGAGGSTGVSCDQYDPCGDHGTCNDSGGMITCVCDAGYTGVSCSTCDGGYHWEGGLCVADMECLPNTCSGHGTCDDTDGVVTCSCDLGYTGQSCNECAGGYHWEGELCVMDETCLPATCSGHGTCDDTGGVVTCSCDLGYTGPSCNECAGGYHWQGNVCVLDETCLPTSCSGHGTCSDTGGVISCSCDQGYSGSYCDTCAPGFQDNDSDGSCLPSCALANPPCDHGACSDADGTADCACNPGYSGPLCATCNDDSLEDNDTDSTGTFLSGDYSSPGLVVCHDDEDWFQIVLNESDSIDITVSFTNSSGNIDLYLWYPFDSAPSGANQVAASESTTADSESISYSVPAGAGGTYYIEVKTWSDIRNTYSITVDESAGPGCYTCASLSKQCGTWDDNCNGTLTCGPCGATETCDAYFGVCAGDLCDLATGCCEGATLKTCAFGGQDEWDCASWGLQCGWIDDATTFPGLPGYFACDSPANFGTPPAGIPLQCPAGMGFP